MLEQYHNLIEKMSKTLFDELLEVLGGSVLEAGVEEFDKELHPLLLRIGSGVMESLLNRLSAESVQADQSPGDRLHKNAQIEYYTLFGPLRVSSPYLYNREEKRGKRPLHTRGVRHQGQSLALQEALSSFGSEESFGRAAHLFAEHYHWSVHRSTVRQTTLKHAQRAEGYLIHRHQARLAAPLPSPGVERLLIELDGCELPMGRYRCGRDGKKRRDLYWREARCGLARRMGEVEKLYTARMDTYERVVEGLRAIALEKGMGQKTKLVAVGDGGNGLKEALDEQFYPLQFILDRPHLKSHFYETAQALGKSENATNPWIARQMDRLHQGQVGVVIDNLKRQQKRNAHERRGRLIAYLTRFRDCVHYDQYRQQEWPIGSGEIESTHRILPQKRMKIAGAWWDESNVNPMLALRTIRCNDWWEELWKAA